MNAIEKLSACLEAEVQSYLAVKKSLIKEVRIRTGRPVQIISDEDMLVGSSISPEQIKNILNLLTDYSLYSKENELREGFFTLKDGSRVGVCGKVFCENGQVAYLTHVGSLTVRISREIIGCAEPLIKYLTKGSNIRSAIVFSQPGLGKTTLLRDMARMLSNCGWRVAIADERHEIAACVQGMPTLDVGLRTDVLDGCPRSSAIEQFIRTMSPQVIVTDEIGDEDDVRALADACRCGISVIASAHAGSYEELSQRAAFGKVFESGIFELGIRLCEQPGHVSEIRKCILKKGGGFEWVSV